MTDFDSLYEQVRPDIEQLAEALFGASQVFVRKRGAFLPHGAVLLTSGEVRFVMAAPDHVEQDLPSVEILPNLHEAVRQSVVQNAATSLGVSEDVRITVPGQPETKAIKVLIEHQRGFCVASNRQSVNRQSSIRQSSIRQSAIDDPQSAIDQRQTGEPCCSCNLRHKLLSA